MSFFDDAISTIGRGLAQTAVGELTDATGFDIGGTLNFLFGPDGGGSTLTDLSSKLSNPADNFPVTPAELTYLQESVTQQQQQITIIGEQLAAVLSTVDAIKMETDEIDTLLKQLEQQALYQAWQTVDTPTKDHISAIQTAYQMYSMFISEYGEPTGPTTLEVEELVAQILSPNDGPLESSNFIHNLILDQGMQQGLLQLWSNMVCELVNSGVMDYRDAAAQYMDYYKTLTFAQLSATNLVMEAYNYNGDLISLDETYNSYKKAILAQESTFINWLMPIINSGITGSKDPNSQWYVLQGTIACMDLNPNYSMLPQGPNYYSPSPILYEAERLLQSLFCTDDEDRRIVVHMAYYAFQSFSSLLQPVVLSLDGVNSGTVTPTSKDLFGPYAADTTPGDDFPDENWCSFGLNYYLRRFVYSTNRDNAAAPTLPDDDYTLTNLNGQNGLIPMDTYTSVTRGDGGTTAFQLNPILGYGLTVNEQAPFDFMNFLAYNYPYNA